MLTIEWIEPTMIGGTWMPELIAIAGGEPLVTEPGDHAPTLSREQLEALRPDVVVLERKHHAERVEDVGMLGLVNLAPVGGHGELDRAF